jgi:MFS family permease
MAFTLLLSLLVALPSFGIDMSLPALTATGAALGVAPAQAGMTMSLFMLGFAVAPLFYGPASDRYGRKPIVVFACLLFIIAGIGCALAHSLSTLLMWRVVQGAGAGASMTIALAIIRDLFEGQAALTKLSYVAIATTIVPMIAPTLAALANQPDLLVVVTAGGRAIDAIPGPIPNNARLASYLPFEWILPKLDVFVTNGGYGSVNQAMSFGIPLVTAGLTEDKADVNARVAWSGVGIDLATNEPTPLVLRDAVRTVLDKPNYRLRASLMAEEFDGIDTRSEILRIVSQVSHTPDEDGLRRSAVAENNSIQAHLNANHLAPID